MKVYKLAHDHTELSEGGGWTYLEYIPFFARGKFYLIMVQDRFWRDPEANQRLISKVLEKDVSQMDDVSRWRRDEYHINTGRYNLEKLTRDGRFNFYKGNPYIEEYHSLYSHQGKYWAIYSSSPALDIFEYQDAMRKSYESCLETLKDLKLMNLKGMYDSLYWANRLRLDQKQHTQLIDDFLKDIRKQIKTK